MTKDDVIAMADKVGVEIVRGDGWPDERLIKKLEAFAMLAAAAEREACIKACDVYGGDHYVGLCMDAIRARGQ